MKSLVKILRNKIILMHKITKMITIYLVKKNKLNNKLMHFGNFKKRKQTM
jgi:hypothetical protein